MSKYKYLLWDLDGTIFNFQAAEKAAIKSLFTKYNLGECSDEMISRYSVINDGYWKALERGEISKPELLVARFRDFLESEGLDSSIANDFNADYQLSLGDTIVLNDDAFEFLCELKNDFVLIAVTNGTKVAQDKKLSLSKLDTVFDHIFISETVGIEKPNKGYFDYVISKAKIYDLSQAVIIGDSLTSDIKGGNTIGIDTCWYNPKHASNDKGVDVTFEIENLIDLKSYL